MFIHIY